LEEDLGKGMGFRKRHVLTRSMRGYRERENILGLKSILVSRYSSGSNTRSAIWREVLGSNRGLLYFAKKMGNEKEKQSGVGRGLCGSKGVLSINWGGLGGEGGTKYGN